MKGYFITGTDTGVGKTFVTCAIARLWREKNKRVFAFKPLETGCARIDGELVGADQELLATAAGDWQQGSLRHLYRFAQAAAPWVAAVSEGATVDLGLISKTLGEGSALSDVTLVEGAGGWRVPITPTIDMGGLARRVGYPVIVVARAGLGTINHTLLTLEACERDGCSVAAVVLSIRPNDDRNLAASNADQIKLRWSGRLVTTDDLTCFT